MYGDEVLNEKENLYKHMMMQESAEIEIDANVKQ